MGRFDGDDAAQAFSRILHSLMQISRGASFCEDRGFGWAIDDEMKEGRAFIAEAFAAFPELRERMPQRAKALAEDTLLANVSSSELEETRAYFRAVRPREPATPIPATLAAEIGALDEAAALRVFGAISGRSPSCPAIATTRVSNGPWSKRTMSAAPLSQPPSFCIRGSRS